MQNQFAIGSDLERMSKTCLHCQEDKKIWELMAGKRKSVDLDGSREAAKTYCDRHRKQLEENLKLLREDS